jgi:hypothetical protein
VASAFRMKDEDGFTLTSGENLAARVSASGTQMEMADYFEPGFRHGGARSMVAAPFDINRRGPWPATRGGPTPNLFALSGSTQGVLCRCLCRKPAVPAIVASSPMLSLGHTQKATSVRETSMNTACSVLLRSPAVCPYSFALGNCMEEVIGSIPIRSTNLFN